MLSFIGFIVLISIGYFCGRYNEKRHFESINQREQQLINIVTTSSKRPVGDFYPQQPAKLVTGSVVISIDYFKRFIAILQQLFGGNVSAYETLVDRARREAVLRLKEASPHAKQIINLRLETSSIFKGEAGQVGSVEVLAYGTALY